MFTFFSKIIQMRHQKTNCLPGPGVIVSPPYLTWLHFTSDRHLLCLELTPQSSVFQSASTRTLGCPITLYTSFTNASILAPGQEIPNEGLEHRPSYIYMGFLIFSINVSASKNCAQTSKLHILRGLMSSLLLLKSCSTFEIIAVWK